MSIRLHGQLVFTIACSTESCAGPDEGLPATDEDGRTRYFDTQAEAATWAATEGWDAAPLGPVLCPSCAADARDLADHQAEIAAAIQHAINEE